MVVEPVKGNKVSIEFYCTNCHHYAYLKLNLAIEGNHVIVCGNCEHKHYREVKKGIITGDRFNESLGIADEIIMMKSAMVPPENRRKRGLIAQIREAEAVGEHR